MIFVNLSKLKNASALIVVISTPSILAGIVSSVALKPVVFIPVITLPSYLKTDEAGSGSGLRSDAIFLNSLPDVLRVYSNDRAKEKISLAGRGVARDFMKAKLFGKEIEQVYMVAVDAKDNFIRMEKLASGDGVAVSVPVREIADFALRTGACGILLAHNHPSGDLSPSADDLALTLKIRDMLKNISVTLQDHFIFSDRKYYSFEENGLIPQK